MSAVFRESTGAGGRAEPVVVGSEVRPADSVEYDLAATATATLTGPAGTVVVRRRYRALPRHDDVVAAATDGLVDRPHEVYVHSEYYRVVDGTADYRRDRHEQFAPGGAALADAGAFRDAGEAHHVDALAADYGRAADGGVVR